MNEGIERGSRVKYRAKAISRDLWSPSFLFSWSLCIPLYACCTDMRGDVRMSPKLGVANSFLPSFEKNINKKLWNLHRKLLRLKATKTEIQIVCSKIVGTPLYFVRPGLHAKSGATSPIPTRTHPARTSDKATRCSQTCDSTRLLR